MNTTTSGRKIKSKVVSDTSGKAFTFKDWFHVWHSWTATLLHLHRTTFAGWESQEGWNFRGYSHFAVTDRCSSCIGSTKFPGWAHVNSIDHIADVCAVEAEGVREILRIFPQLKNFSKKDKYLPWENPSPLRECWIELARRSGVPETTDYVAEAKGRAELLHMAFTRHKSENRLSRLFANGIFDPVTALMTDEAIKLAIESPPKPSKIDAAQFTVLLFKDRSALCLQLFPYLEDAMNEDIVWLEEDKYADLHFLHAVELSEDGPDYLSKRIIEASEQAPDPGPATEYFSAWRTRIAHLASPEKTHVLDEIGSLIELAGLHDEVNEALRADDATKLQALILGGVAEVSVPLEKYVIAPTQRRRGAPTSKFFKTPEDVEADLLRSAVYACAPNCIRLLLLHRPFFGIPWKLFTTCTSEGAPGLAHFVEILHKMHGERIWSWIDEAIGNRQADQEGLGAVKSAVEHVKFSKQLGSNDIGTSPPRPPRGGQKGPRDGL